MYFLHGWLLKGKKQKLLGRLGPSRRSLASLALYAIGQSNHRVPQDTSRLNLLTEVGKGHILQESVGWELLYGHLENMFYHIVQGLANFYCKDKIVNILDFTSHVVPVMIPQLCYCSTKGVTDNI